MEYNNDTKKQANEYIKYISHTDVVKLVMNINENETNPMFIKSLLSDCLDKQIQCLPIQHDALKKNVFKTFCLMVKNNETHIFKYGIVAINGKKLKQTIPKINTIAKISVNEWIDEKETDLQSNTTNEMNNNPVNINITNNNITNNTKGLVNLTDTKIGTKEETKEKQSFISKLLSWISIFKK
jgi:hypothetical protein